MASTTIPNFRVCVKHLMVIDLVLAALVATVNSLTLYMGGEAIGAFKPVTVSAAFFGWLLNFLLISVFQAFFMAIFGCIAAVFVGLIVTMMNKKNADAGKTDEEFSNALWKLGRWGLTIDVSLSLLIAVYNSTVQYGILSALHADPTLNLVTAILSGILTFIYSSFVLGFFMSVATFILGGFYFVLSGGMNKVANQNDKSAPDTK